MKFVRPTAKIILLIINLLPFITMGLSIALLEPNVPTKEPFWITLSIAMFASVPFGWIFYISNVFRNKTVARNQRVLWIFLLFVGHILVFPVYWYLHIWRDTKEKRQEEPVIAAPVSADKQEAKCKGIVYKLLLLIFSLLPLLFWALSAYSRLYGSDKYFYSMGITAYALWACLVAFYLINVFKNEKVAKNIKVLWTVILIFMNVPGFVVYWYLYIRRGQSVVESNMAGNSSPVW